MPSVSEGGVLIVFSINTTARGKGSVGKKFVFIFGCIVLTIKAKSLSHSENRNSRTVVLHGTAVCTMFKS
jgi:hypothetical protein